MTKPRLNTQRKLYGIIGSFPQAGKIQSLWNTTLEKRDIDGFMDKYPTTSSMVHERLSEMFHFDRRFYIVGPDLTQHIMEYIDILDNSVKRHGGIDFIVNNQGVFTGYHLDLLALSNDELVKKVFDYR